MRLYHGSTVDIETIDLEKSKPFKDFGKGFYLSADKEQAIKLATYKVLQVGGEVCINEYEFDEKSLSDGSLRVLSFEGYTKEWAEFVYNNRDEHQNFTHTYDIVYGPIANDRVGVQIRQLRENNISPEVFLERLKYMKGITYQYFFATEKAIQLLRKI